MNRYVMEITAFSQVICREIVSRENAMTALGEGQAIWDRLDKGQVHVITRCRAFAPGFVYDIKWERYKDK